MSEYALLMSVYRFEGGEGGIMFLAVTYNYIMVCLSLAMFVILCLHRGFKVTE